MQEEEGGFIIQQGHCDFLPSASLLFLRLMLIALPGDSPRSQQQIDVSHAPSFSAVVQMMSAFLHLPAVSVSESPVTSIT